MAERKIPPLPPGAEKLPYWRFWAYDWDSDVVQKLLGCSGAGIYVRLLNQQWIEGSLPEDPEQLRVLVGATEDEWTRAWKLLEARFPVTKNGSRKNKKQERNRRETNEFLSKRRRAGRLGGLARSKQMSSPSSKAKAKPKHSSSNAEALPSHLIPYIGEAKGQRSLELRDEKTSDRDRDLSKKGNATTNTTIIKWSRDEKDFVGNITEMKRELSDRYLDEFGKEWLNVTYRDMRDWCIDNPERIAAKRDFWRFVLGWYRRQAGKTRRGER